MSTAVSGPSGLDVRSSDVPDAITMPSRYPVEGAWSMSDRPTRILVVEDEESYRDALKTSLEREGYEVQLAADGPQGLRFFTEHPPDMVLLDVMLPGISGVEVCRQMQGMSPAIPIIMVTALNAEVDVVLGLELGAADYLTKPYRLRELIARIQTVLRRVAPPELPSHEQPRHEPSEPAGKTPVSIGPVTVDFMRREVRVNGTPVHMSRREFDILAVMASPPGQVRTREELIDRLWSDAELSDTRTLDTHIRRVQDEDRSRPATSPPSDHHPRRGVPARPLRALTIAPGTPVTTVEVVADTSHRDEVLGPGRIDLELHAYATNVGIQRPWVLELTAGPYFLEQLLGGADLTGPLRQGQEHVVLHLGEMDGASPHADTPAGGLDGQGPDLDDLVAVGHRGQRKYAPASFECAPGGRDRRSAWSHSRWLRFRAPPG